MSGYAETGSLVGALGSLENWLLRIKRDVKDLATSVEDDASRVTTAVDTIKKDAGSAMTVATTAAATVKKSADQMSVAATSVAKAAGKITTSTSSMSLALARKKTTGGCGSDQALEDVAALMQGSAR